MLKDDIKEFFEVVKDNSKLKNYLNNKYIQIYLKVIEDRFLNFPKVDYSNIVCFGYPNSEYLERRIVSFDKLIDNLKNHTIETKDIPNQIRNFLSSCHSDDEVEENEYKLFYYIFNKSEVISKKEIKKLTTFSTSNKLSYPATFTCVPYGTFVNISKKGNKYLISSSIDANFDFLKIKTKKDFKASLIIGVKWFKKDIHYHNSEKAKWIDSLISGVKKEQSIAYILKISDSEIIKEFERNEISTEILESFKVESEEKAIKKYNKAKKLGYRGIICGKHIFTDDTFDTKDFEVHKG